MNQIQSKIVGNITPISNRRRETTIEEYAKNLTSSSWTVRARCFLDFVGRSEPYKIEKGDFTLHMSEAQKNDISTVGSAIEALGVSETILQDIIALYLRSQLGVPGDDPASIVSKHQALVSYLGRDPQSATEVSSIIGAEKESKINFLSHKLDKKEDEIQAHLTNVASLEARLTESEAAFNDKKNILIRKIEEYKEKIEGFEDRHKKEIEIIRESHAEKIKSVSNNLRTELEQEHRAEIEQEKLRQEAITNSALQERDELIQSLRDTIENEMIPLQTYNVAVLEAEQGRDINRENLARIAEYQQIVNDLSTGQGYEEKVQELSDKLIRLETAYKITKKKMEEYQEENRRLVQAIKQKRKRANSPKFVAGMATITDFVKENYLILSVILVASVGFMY